MGECKTLIRDKGKSGQGLDRYGQGSNRFGQGPDKLGQGPSSPSP